MVFGGHVATYAARERYRRAYLIIPTALGEFLGDPDPGQAQRVMDAMLKMHKIDIKGLKDAYEEK